MLCVALSPLSLRVSTATEGVEGEDFTFSADLALATMEEEDDEDAGFSTGGAGVSASEDV